MVEEKNGLVAGNAQNEASGKHVRTRSKFPLNYDFFDSYRFGEYHPFFVQECVDTDSVKLLTGQKVHSYTLAAPLMQNIMLKKDLFLVPMQALLPRNWEKFYTNPVIGDDVPSYVGPCLTDFWQNVFSHFVQNWAYATQLQTITITQFVAALIYGEMFFSNGNLLSSLGIHGSKFCRARFVNPNPVPGDPEFDSIHSFDFVFDRFWDICAQNGVVFTLNAYSGTYEVRADVDPLNRPSGYVLTYREMLDILRDEPGVLMNGGLGLGVSSWNGTGDFFDTVITPEATYWSWIDVTSVGDHRLNWSRPAAYQIVCRHFYSNDHVDYIYSASLYREYLRDLLGRMNSTWPSDRFTLNGLQYYYDELSAYYMAFVLNNTLSAANQFSSLCEYGLNFLRAIFGYNRSLRFLDYFTGSRTRPLAVGDLNVDVQSGSPNYVNVVDISRNIQRQRFFNAVNRSGRKFSAYLQELFGKAPAHDWHDPLYLGHTSDTIYGDSSEYTGSPSAAEQQNQVTQLKNSGSRYEFSFETDRDCVVIGIAYFDIPRVYTNTIERQALHLDRFDMFNPYMQFVGDQKVYKDEVVADGSDGLDPFSYQLRHIEYKQRYHQASGAFVENLPGFVFLNDVGRRVYENTLSPGYIRSMNAEFDRLFLLLTGWSLGSYFHVGMMNMNRADSSRPMAFAPSIL